MNYRDILPADVAELRAEADLLVIDTRDAASYASGHLEEAQPLSDPLLQKLIRSRQRQRPILVYCYHGNSSRDICQFLAGFGFARVHNLVGGWQGWQGFSAEAAVPAVDLAAWLGRWGFPADGGVHCRLDNGMSPLMVAALKGDRAMVEMLLAKGANPNHVNEDDHHALWFACVHGDPDLVSLLLERGADVDNQNVNGVTCAIYAASTGKLEILKRLVAAGADLGKENYVGASALDSASTLAVLRYLQTATGARALAA